MSALQNRIWKLEGEIKELDELIDNLKKQNAEMEELIASLTATVDEYEEPTL